MEIERRGSTRWRRSCCYSHDVSAMGRRRNARRRLSVTQIRCVLLSRANRVQLAATNSAHSNPDQGGGEPRPYKIHSCIRFAATNPTDSYSPRAATLFSPVATLLAFAYYCFYP